MIEIITIAIAVILMIMFVLAGILCILYFKSRSKEPSKSNAVSAKKESKVAKNYTTESVFDFMEFDKIEDNMISTKNGAKYVMVVECQGVNYDLMSEIEKNAVEEGFIQFLNTLRHPIQIYTQTRTINLESSIQTYRTKIEEIEQELEKEKRKYEQMLSSGKYSQEQLNAAFYELTKTTNLYEYGKDIIYTTERMSLNKNVLNQKYYIVIPYYPEELGENNFDKQEIRNLAFSELYTRAQSIIRTLSVCGVNGRVLDSNSLVDLLYVAYNRDSAEIYGVDKAIKAGYDELYSTAPDILDKKMVAIDHQIEKEAFEKANQKVLEAKSEKQKELERKQDNMEDLIDQVAKMIIDQNKNIVGKDVAQKAIEKVNEDTVKRRGRPKKQVNTEEGGTNENEQEKQAKGRRVTKTA
ncbi:MAG: hypothetical protein HFJ28_02195 [Clostridia bacterium]|nr:hypothetical protein [Clostridia bacterium]